MKLIDPTHETSAFTASPAARPADLVGTTIGFVSNGKANTVAFFDHLERLAREHWGVAEVVRLTKVNYSAPASDEIMAATLGWAALLAGVGD